MASELTPMERAVRAGTVEAPEPFRDIEPTAGSRALLINMHSLPHWIGLLGCWRQR